MRKQFVKDRVGQLEAERKFWGDEYAIHKDAFALKQVIVRDNMLAPVRHQLAQIENDEQSRNGQS